MRKAPQLLFPIAVSALLAACSGNGTSGGVTPAAPPIQDPAISSTQPTSQVDPTTQTQPTTSPEATTQSSDASEVTTQAMPASSGTLIWKAGDGAYGKWGVA